MSLRMCPDVVLQFCSKVNKGRKTNDEEAKSWFILGHEAAISRVCQSFYVGSVKIALNADNWKCLIRLLSMNNTAFQFFLIIWYLIARLVMSQWKPHSNFHSRILIVNTQA